MYVKRASAAALGIIIASIAVLLYPSITLDVYCGIDAVQEGPKPVYVLRVTLSPAQYMFYQGNDERLTDAEGSTCGSV